MASELKGDLSAKGLRLAIVVSRFNSFVTERLLAGGRRAPARARAHEKKIEVVRVPGSFEIPVAAKQLAQTGRYHALICLGCILRGDTQHFDFISAEGTRAVQAPAP